MIDSGVIDGAASDCDVIDCTGGDFATRLLPWFDRHGRHDFPWQHPRNAYRVWLSEIMLQQTRVGVVAPYFQRFVDTLPDLPALAAAPLDQVFALWSGLGYYSRARNLHRAAQICVEQYAGKLPVEFAALIALPGIGRSTAGAILAQAYGLRAPILDGNAWPAQHRLVGQRHPAQARAAGQGDRAHFCNKSILIIIVVMNKNTFSD